ncbi:MAG TPA: B12-binding domain-containing radical SAM protein, partial [Clostridiales bacterium]|nr:B12-binding domain-containing radical SAM protein [Clostridiales bacterium]
GKQVKATGYEEVSMVSLSTSDYTGIDELTRRLLNEMEPQKVNLALPSLRVDSFSLELMDRVRTVRKSGLTFAPEAGTQRLRDVINKNVTSEDLLRSAETAFQGGWDSIKLYFMVGLPTETLEDIRKIADLVYQVVDVWKAVTGRAVPPETAGRLPARRKLNLTVSTSCFVPKPFTPFQWEPQDCMNMLEEKQALLRSLLKDRRISYHWSDPRLSHLEAVLARGDRRLGTVIRKAWELGCKFDSWNEHMKFQTWMEAFLFCRLDPAFYANRKREPGEILPWDHIHMGVSRSFLQKESRMAAEAKTSPHCREACAGCGAGRFEGGSCHVRD